MRAVSHDGPGEVHEFGHNWLNKQYGSVPPENDGIDPAVGDSAPLDLLPHHLVRIMGTRTGSWRSSALTTSARGSGFQVYICSFMTYSLQSRATGSIRVARVRQRELARSIGYQVSRQAAAKEAEEMSEPGNPVLAWHHAPQHAAKEKRGEDSQRDRGATAFKISASEQIAQEPEDDTAGANMNCIGTAQRARRPSH